jgi:hypothetical protein
MSQHSYSVDELQLITGVDLPIEELGLTLRQPRVKEIAILGESNYFIALSLVKLTTESLKIDHPEATNWLIFQEALKQEVPGVKNTRALITNFLQLFILGKVTLGPRSIIIDIENELKNIEPEQFPLFQDALTTVGGASLLVPAKEEFNPRNKRAAEIAEKKKKARAKLAALQPKNKSNGFIARYIRAVAIGTNNSLAEIGNMTLLQLNEMMASYLAWESYDLEVKSRLAGAKGDNKLVHWIMREEKADAGVTI